MDFLQVLAENADHTGKKRVIVLSLLKKEPISHIDCRIAFTAISAVCIGKGSFFDVIIL